MICSYRRFVNLKWFKKDENNLVSDLKFLNLRMFFFKTFNLKTNLKNWRKKTNRENDLNFPLLNLLCRYELNFMTQERLATVISWNIIAQVAFGFFSCQKKKPRNLKQTAVIFRGQTVGFVHFYSSKLKAALRNVTFENSLFPLTNWSNAVSCY